MLGRRNTGDIFLLADGRVLVVGGSTPEPIFTVAEIYDPATGTWASAWPVERLPEGAMVVHLADGRLLVAGGSFVDSSAAYLATAQLNDPMTGAWWTTASMPKACVYCDGLVLSDGRVLVIGGFSDDGYTMGLLYDPTAGRWSVTTPPSQPGPLAALLLLRNGQALALHESPSAAEVYDPEAGTWTKVASRMTAGDLRTATVLADGRVLVTVADIYSDAQPPSWAEIYDPLGGSWIFGETMTTHRVFHSATLLADGRVLVAGDSTRGEQTYPAEIFDPAALR